MNLRWTRDAIYCLLVLRFVDVNLVLSLCLSLSLSQGTSLLQLMKRLAPRNDFLLLLRCLQPGKMAEFFSLPMMLAAGMSTGAMARNFGLSFFIPRRTLQRKSRP